MVTQLNIDPELRALPLFQGLSVERFADLTRRAVHHRVTTGTVLFEQGETPNFQHLVVAGAVHLFGRSAQGREVLIETVEAPDLVVPAAIMTGAPYLVRARVPMPSRLLLIEAAVFRAAVASDLALAQGVIGSLAGQFRRLVRQIKNLKLRTAPQRVGCYILVLSAHQGTADRAVLRIEKNLVASELGITRESFSRALASLQDIRCIRVENETIRILDAPRLAAECSPDPLIDEAEPLPESPTARRNGHPDGRRKEPV